MALTSTLFTGLSGLAVNQTRLNVVGNNIANVNTTAFKSSRALFKPQFYVTDAAGTPPSGDFGGTNPSQRGLGAMVASIEKDFQAGSIETTGRSTDMAIDGNGFFIVDGAEGRKYTRDGSFNLNQQNELVSSGGAFVQGFQADEDGNIVPGTLGKLTIPFGTLTKAEATREATLTGNLNADGAIATAGSVVQSQPMTDITSDPVNGTAPAGATLLTNLRNVDPSGLPTGTALFTAGQTLTVSGKRGGRTLPELSMDITAATTVDDYNTFMNQALGIDTSVVTPGYTAGNTLATATGDFANTMRLTTNGNVGQANAIDLSGSAVSNGSLIYSQASAAVGESVTTSFPIYDSLGTPLNINITSVLESKTDEGTTWRFYAYSGDDTDSAAFDATGASQGLIVGNGTMSFDNQGKLLSTTSPALSVTRTDTGSTTPLSIGLDFSAMNALADPSGTSASNSSLYAQADGKPIGTLSTFEIGADGMITGAFDNGSKEVLGQVAMATFDNQLGLVDTGGNMFVSGGNSGTPKISAPLELSAGAIRSGSLEMSNVDLSEQFTNMIIASTGFTAASRVISTADRLITELLNTSR